MKERDKDLVVAGIVAVLGIVVGFLLAAVL